RVGCVVLAGEVGEANVGAAVLRARVPVVTVRVAVAAALDRLGDAAPRLAAGDVDAGIGTRGAPERRARVADVVRTRLGAVARLAVVAVGVGVTAARGRERAGVSGADLGTHGV